MQRLLIAAALAGLFTVGAVAQTTGTPTCKATAAEKKLAGAALNSFMKKCERDAATACTKAATDKSCPVRPRPATSRSAPTTRSAHKHRPTSKLFTDARPPLPAGRNQI